MGVSDMNDHGQRLIVAESSSPEGRFVYRNDLLPPFSIDAHVVESGGGLYLFYSTNDFKAQKAEWRLQN